MIATCWNAKAHWISRELRLAIAEKTYTIVYAQERLKSLKVGDPTDPAMAKYNSKKLLVDHMAQELRSMMLGAIVDAFESPNPNPINLWIER